MKLPFEMISPGDNDCAVEAHENAQDDSQQNAPNHHQWPKKDGQASDWHANYFKGRAFTADEVVQQPLPAFEEHVGALDQRDPRLIEWRNGPHNHGSSRAAPRGRLGRSGSTCPHVPNQHAAALDLDLRPVHNAVQELLTSLSCWNALKVEIHRVKKP